MTPRKRCAEILDVLLPLRAETAQAGGPHELKYAKIFPLSYTQQRFILLESNTTLITYDRSKA